MVSSLAARPVVAVRRRPPAGPSSRSGTARRRCRRGPGRSGPVRSMRPRRRRTSTMSPSATSSPRHPARTAPPTRRARLRRAAARDRVLVRVWKWYAVRPVCEQVRVVGVGSSGAGVVCGGLEDGPAGGLPWRGTRSVRPWRRSAGHGRSSRSSRGRWGRRPSAYSRSAPSGCSSLHGHGMPLPPRSWSVAESGVVAGPSAAAVLPRLERVLRASATADSGAPSRSRKSMRAA